MAGLRGVVAGLVIGSAAIALPAAGQSAASVSLTHTVNVTVPPRLKVQVSNLAFSSSVPVSVSSIQPRADGLAITINATQAWVLSIGSSSRVAAPKSRVQWSVNGSSDFSSVTTRDVAVASGESYDAKAANVFFRNAPSVSGSRIARAGDGELVVLTVVAP